VLDYYSRDCSSARLFAGAVVAALDAAADFQLVACRLNTILKFRV
jgi:hypothetical protein